MRTRVPLKWKDDALFLVQTVPYWRHSVQIRHGIRTPGRIGRELITRLCLPTHLRGKRVLDVGTFDGLVAFEAERLGASEVLAIDTWSGKGSDDPDWWRSVHTGGSGFRVAAELLNSKVLGKEMSVYSVCPTLGYFDLIILSGVLYHLRRPLTALRRLHSVCSGMLVVESLVIEGHGILATDVKAESKISGTNEYWHFTLAGLLNLCEKAGFTNAEVRHTSWHSTTVREIELTEACRGYKSPSTKDAATAQFAPGNYNVLSHKVTRREGLQWLRLKHSDGKFAWVRFPSRKRLSLVTVNSRSQKERRLGRAVVHLYP